MILHINTTKGDDIEIKIIDSGKELFKKKISAPYTQAEKLLPLIDKILKSNKLDLKDIKRVQVNNNGGSFTALRIGVVTANALGYALGVPVEGVKKDLKAKNRKFSVVEPIYSKEPNITTRNT